MKAISFGDLAHARTRGFNARVSTALAQIDEAVRIGKVGVSVSGGKDSLVLLDLARRVIPDIPAAFYDSGCEYPSTYEVIEHYGVETITPQRNLLEMLRYGGYWGYEKPTDPDAEFDFFSFLVGEPSQRFIALHDLAVVGIGLREQESAGRRMSGRRNGELYQLKSGIWHLCPLAKWTSNDVWGYIASRKLRYNTAYDRMAEVGIPRESWRICALLGMKGANTQGRFAFLRQMYPDLFRCLAAEFPKIREYT